MVQNGKLPDQYYTPEGAHDFLGLLQETGIRASAVVAVYDGESYKDIPSIRETVGFRPIAQNDQRAAYTRKCIDFAAALGVKIVTFHAGFLPADVKDPNYQRVVRVIDGIARYGASKGVTISLETGQETADELLGFIGQIRGARVGINFDMANLVMYGKDDSPAALRKLLSKVTSVHVKDGLAPDDPSQLGSEVRLGEGKASVRECLRILSAAHFTGPLVIENYVARSHKTDPMSELGLAKAYLDTALSELE